MIENHMASEYLLTGFHSSILLTLNQTLWDYQLTVDHVCKWMTMRRSLFIYSAYFEANVLKSLTNRRLHAKLIILTMVQFTYASYIEANTLRWSINWRSHCKWMKIRKPLFIYSAHFESNVLRWSIDRKSCCKWMTIRRTSFIYSGHFEANVSK
jgi:hypothetical protein